MKFGNLLLALETTANKYLAHEPNPKSLFPCCCVTAAEDGISLRQLNSPYSVQHPTIQVPLCKSKLDRVIWIKSNCF